MSALLVLSFSWDAVSASLVLSFSCLRSCLPAGPMWPRMLCPPLWSCLSLVSGLVSQLVPSGLGCCVRLPGLVFLLPPVLPPKLVPPGLGSCVRLAGLVFLLSPDLSPSLSPVLARILCPPCWSCLSLGMLCPPPWSCLSLVSGLVSQLAPCGLGCCVHLSGLVFLLSPVIWSGMLCRPRWSCLSLVSQLVPSGLGCCVRLGLVFLPRQFAVEVLHAFLVCLPCLECCARRAGLVFLLSPAWSPHLVFQLVWDAVSGFLASLPAQLVSGLVFHLVWDAVSVLWACLKNVMCDLCNFWGCTVV